ncbi:MAG TPA: NAD(P)-dependent glycerol-1-phosphate dehydrogenase [Methanocorpusculum sp.]|nr:NAD(P)-dependent glycerol-1-phosphate dehydrogenase [Methanocorpusculum sp.]
MSDKEYEILKNKNFDKSRWIQLPRDVVVGHGVITQIPAVVSELCLQGPILVISGKTTMQTTGVKVLTLLTEAGYDASSLIAGDITYEEVTRVANYAKALGSVLLIAVGGGRVIDIAKIVSYNIDIQFISVPTTASHDGITSSRASIHTETGSISVAAHPPIAIIGDTEILADSPHRLTASGFADIVANYTAVLDWELANKEKGEKISEYALTLSMISAELLVENADNIHAFDEKAAWILMKALFASGVAMSIAGSSRPASGSEHKFAHILEQTAPGKVLHGEACGIGTIISMYLHGGNWQKIKNSLETVGAPITPKQIGLTDEQVVDAVMTAHTIRPDRYTIFDTAIDRKQVEEAVAALYTDTQNQNNTAE